MSKQPPDLDSLFEAASEIESTEDRARFLDQACGENHALRQHVERLLKSNVQVGSFLEKTPAEFEATIFGPEEGDLDVSIARGLDYYTGTIYETFLTDLPGIGSVCSGGRYDNLTGYFGLKDVSGVGISFGVARIFDVMEELVKFTLMTRDQSDYLVDRYSQRKESAEDLLARVNTG